MSSWLSTTIDNIAQKIAMGPFGSNIKVETFVPAGIPIISGQHLHGTRLNEQPGFNFITEEHAERLANSIVFPGDIILTHAGTIGQVSRIPDDATFSRFIISQRQFYLRLDASKADPEFITYWFHSPVGRHRLLMNASQVGVPSLSRPTTNLRETQIELPPLPEQRAIASVLGALDDKIALNRRMNATLEAMARALFRDWFVDFGPTRAKEAKEPPTLAPDLWSLFPARLDEHGIPEGWEVKPLDEIADFLNGLALQKFPAKDDEDSLPVIKIAELRSGITAKSGRASRDVPAQYVIQDGDFLFSWSGSLLAKFWTDGEGALNQHLFKVSSSKYPVWFFTGWVLHYLDEFQAIAASKATTMGHIQRQHLKEAITVCPPDAMLLAPGEIAAPLIERSIKNNLESRTLARTRDLLLPRLISGELRVREAEEQIEEVL